MEEYDRCNKELDPLAASAEWELERRVAGLTVFRAEVEERTAQQHCAMQFSIGFLLLCGTVAAILLLTKLGGGDSQRTGRPADRYKSPTTSSGLQSIV